MREQYGKAYIRDEFEKIGEQVAGEVTCFLIGEGAMAFYDIKDATKDIDLVVVEEDGFHALVDAAKQYGYKEVKGLSDEYIELGAMQILENQDGCRLDIFHTQIVDELHFSHGMQERAEILGSFDSLIVKMASREDIFLFKSVTDRQHDREDMYTLLQTGLDFDVVLNEMKGQKQLLNSDLFITHINESLHELQKDYGATPSLLQEVEPLAEVVMEKLSILTCLEEPRQFSDLQEELDVENDLDQLLDELEEEGRIEIQDNTICKTELSS